MEAYFKYIVIRNDRYIYQSNITNTRYFSGK